MKIGTYELKVPYVTTAADSMKALIELADPKDSDTIVDLGSGNGRVLIEFAKHGYHTFGYEIRPELVDLTNQKAKELGLEKKIHVSPTSFWDVDLSRFSIVYIYGMTTIMARLEEKLEKEARHSTKVLTNIFTLPHWKIKKTKDYINLYIAP